MNKKRKIKRARPVGADGAAEAKHQGPEPVAPDSGLQTIPFRLPVQQELLPGAGPADGPIVRTMREVAARMEVGVRTVAYWKTEGMPGEEGHYNVNDIMLWCASKRRGRFKNMKEAPAAFEGDGDDAETGTNWDAEYRRAKAQLAQIELDIKLGELLRRRDVEAASVKKILAVKQALLGLPNQLAPQLAGQDAATIASLLDQRLRQIIADFAGESPETLGGEQQTGDQGPESVAPDSGLQTPDSESEGER